MALFTIIKYFWKVAGELRLLRRLVAAAWCASARQNPIERLFRSLAAVRVILAVHTLLFSHAGSPNEYVLI